MAMDVKLKPGWLTRDISKASQRANERDALRARILDKSSTAQSSIQAQKKEKDSSEGK